MSKPCTKRAKCVGKERGPRKYRVGLHVSEYYEYSQVAQTDASKEKYKKRASKAISRYVFPALIICSISFPTLSMCVYLLFVINDKPPFVVSFSYERGYLSLSVFHGSVYQGFNSFFVRE